MKPFYQSKTLIFNVVAIIVLVANQFGFGDFQLDAEVSAGIVAVINMILRVTTTQALTVK